MSNSVNNFLGSMGDIPTTPKSRRKNSKKHGINISEIENSFLTVGGGVKIEETDDDSDGMVGMGNEESPSEAPAKKQEEGRSATPSPQVKQNNQQNNQPKQANTGGNQQNNQQNSQPNQSNQPKQAQQPKNSGQSGGNSSPSVNIAEINMLKNKLDQVIKSQKEMSEKLTENINNVATLTGKNKEDLTSFLRSQFGALNNSFTRLESSLEASFEVEERITPAASFTEEEYEKLLKEKDEVKALLDQMTEAAEGQGDQIAEKEEAIKKLGEELDALKAENKRLTDENAKITQEKDRYRAAVVKEAQRRQAEVNAQQPQNPNPAPSKQPAPNAAPNPSSAPSAQAGGPNIQNPPINPAMNGSTAPVISPAVSVTSPVNIKPANTTVSNPVPSGSTAPVGYIPQNYNPGVAPTSQLPPIGMGTNSQQYIPPVMQPQYQQMPQMQLQGVMEPEDVDPWGNSEAPAAPTIEVDKPKRRWPFGKK